MKTVKPGEPLGSLLKGISKLCGEEYKDILSKLAFDGYKMLVRKTAVDTGYARSKWDIAVDRTPPDTPHKGSRKSKYSSPSVPSSIIKVDSHIVLYNNTEYIIHLENGTPRMRSRPMVAPTLIYLTNVAKKLSKALTKKVYDV